MALARRSFVFGATSTLFAQRRETRRPNILLLVAEYLPAYALGCYGNQEIQTPFLDLLARSGTRFSFHVAASPDPAPGFASLVTGLTPRQCGFSGNQAVGPVPAAPLVSELFSNAGYNCAFVGYWPWGPAPKGQGFDMIQAFPYPAPGQYLGPQITDEAIGFLERHKPSRPFFLLVSYPEPGNSYAGRPEKYYALYETVYFATTGWRPASTSAAANKEYLQDIVASLRLCAAAITALDEQIRRVVGAIDRLNIRDHTVIVFTSTCGHLMGRHGLWGAGRASQPINMFEESVLTPLVWNWPLRVPVEGVRPEIVDSCDLLPTLCELAEIRVPENATRPGRSYLPSVMNKPYPPKQPWRSLAFSHLEDTEMARDPRFKLVLRDEGRGPNEFYNLRQDPAESENEIDNDQYITVIESLSKEIAAWRQKYR